jgi:hypothetical protein
MSILIAITPVLIMPIYKKKEALRILTLSLYNIIILLVSLRPPKPSLEEVPENFKPLIPKDLKPKYTYYKTKS